MLIAEKMIIFIVGVGRSGTTLAQSMVNAHPEVCFPPETHFFRNKIQNKRLDKLLRKNNLKKIISNLKNDKNLKRLEIDIEEIIKQIYEKKKFPSGKEIYLSLLTNYAHKRKKNIIGDKDPKNIEYISALKHHFPNAFIIHMIRDPRDVILSRRKAKWSKNKIFFTHILAYKAQIQIGRELGKNLFNGHYIEIIYEQLIKNPEKTLKKLCKFLNITYSENMLDFGNSAREIINHSELQWKKEAIGPLLTNNSEKWRNQLTKRQIIIIEQCCEEVFSGKPYQKSINKKNIRHIEKGISTLTSISIEILCYLYKRWRCKKKYE